MQLCNIHKSTKDVEQVVFANVLIRLDVLLTEASSRMNSSLQSDWKNTNCNTNYKNKVVIIK